MHIQIINFNLTGLREEDYVHACGMIAEAFRNVDGLISKVWLKSTETNTYGGVYTWRDKQAMQAFQKTELFQKTATNPKFANLSSRDFAVLEEPTRVTRGLVSEPALSHS